jgi:hypothetical protein
VLVVGHSYSLWVDVSVLKGITHETGTSVIAPVEH